MDSPTKTKIRGFFDFLNQFLAHEQASMILLAIIVGCLAGFGGYFFSGLIEFVKSLFFRGKITLEGANSLPWYIILFSPALGGLLVGILARFAPEIKGHGVPNIIEKLVTRGGRIRKRVIFWGILGSGVTIGSGGSCGKEGPIVQIGSAFGAFIGNFTKLSSNRFKTLVGCGAAAGIAGIFNAPIGGAMFALEVILGDFAVTTFSPIILSAVAGTVVARALRGNVPEILVPNYDLNHPGELVLYAILGVLAAFVGILFIKTLYAMEDFVEKFSHWKKISFLFPMVGGVFVGVIGLRYPYIFGPWTYSTIDLAVAGKILFSTAILLVFVKIIATSLTLGTGGSGGVFAPSLFIGALLGSSFGSVVHNFWPLKTAPSGAYAVVGMAALVAATTQAPLTAIMMLFEITDNYTMILPLMLSCILSAIVLKQINKESIYTEKLIRKGINVHAGRNVNVLKALNVEDCMIREVNTIPETMTFRELLRLMPKTRHYTSYPVVNSKEELTGILSFSDFQSFVFEEGLEDLVIVKELATKEVITVFPDENLQQALGKISSKDVAHIPVVARSNPKKIIGILSRRDIINEYNRALLKYNF